MDSHGFLFNLLVYLSAAVIAVPLFARLGLGSVLGYVVAGICIGPWGLGLIGNVQDTLHFSEIGVVLLLFLIGLELEPRKLWGMRRPILGAGGLQVVLTTAIIALLARQWGLQWNTAIVVGLGLSLSSTAIALQMMNERWLMRTPLGNTGFSILLFQDISVIPIIALIPLLAGQAVDSSDDGGGVSALVVIAVIIGIFVVGKYALQHIFRIVASTHVPEIFTALSLLLVGGVAAIMSSIGVSMALGAFVAGVILADSEYRHALESDIQPFKGLLLGLFFISVGMSIDFGLLIKEPLLILALTICLVLVKTLVLYLVSMMMKIPVHQRGLFSFLLSQSGEFGFVLFGFAVTANAIDPVLADQMILVIAMSMVLTPILVILNDRLIEPRFRKSIDEPVGDTIDESNDVILAGFGRFGQVVGRMLHANQIEPTIIDNDPDHIERVRRFGYTAYYGDVLRPGVLHSAGADKARLIILTGDGKESINQAVSMIQQDFPNLKIVARAYDRSHAMHLIDNGVESVTRESFFSAVEMGKKTLGMLGFDDDSIEKLSKTYVQHDISTLYQQVANRHDEKALINIAQGSREQLEEILEADKAEEQDPDGAPSTRDT